MQRRRARPSTKSASTSGWANTKKNSRSNSVVEWVLNQPADLALYLHQFVCGFDWNTLPDLYCLATGSALSTALLLCRFGRIASSHNSISLNVGSSDVGHANASMATRALLSGTGVTLLAVESLLVGLSVVNAWSLFTRSKRYQLLYANAASPCASANAKLCQITLPAKSGRPTAAAPVRPSGLIRGISIAAEFMRSVGRGRFSGPSTSAPTTRQVWELYKWDPSMFQLKLFSTFSPLHAALIYSIESTNFLWYFALWCSVSFIIYLLAKSFLGLLNDTNLIAGELQNEYNQRFVYPRLFYQRRDVGTTMHDQVAEEIEALLSSQREDAINNERIDNIAASGFPLGRTYSAMWKEPPLTPAIIHATTACQQDENDIKTTPVSFKPPAQHPIMLDSPTIRRIRRSARKPKMDDIF